ncbi:hypothetical protein PSTG_05775 [Puccinia striiformis f. sp. tritici PST-78]|uniref:Reverse transcriptase domain-containing protein n=1 Tax=Puccinia striiformis f. sp. tritici PST-78 TaxID=1165861 RepID=A0A0L0VNM3_9BASI|nr:hypothetical protein PSTG_05775 [Puccinia striiformis f. sp. tritici PST-78]
MFGPFTHDEASNKFGFFRSNPLGSVVNSDGKIRPINDLSHPKKDKNIASVNSFVNKLDYTTTWDDFKVVANFFRSNEGPVELAIFDWEKAYRQIPTLKSQWPFLMVQDLVGGLYVDTRITFGGVAGCGSFGAPADAWKRLMEHEFDVVKVFRWVDDNLFVKSPLASVSIKDVVSRSLELGVATNKEKCSDFSDEQKYIGFIWNGKDSTVRLPTAKLEERKNQIATFLVAGTQFKFNEVEILAGRLNHVAFLLPQLRCYLRGVYRWMNEWKKHEAPRNVPEDVFEDLSFWLQSLQTFENTRLAPIPTPTEIQWVGDASTSFGIGVLIGNRWGQLQMKESWQQGGNGIAWLETVAIRIGIVMLQEIGIARKGSNLIVYTDNTTTESVLSSRKSRDKNVNEEWKLIQKMLINSELDVTPRRVKSEDNIADGLSRGIRFPHAAANRVWFQIPCDLTDVMFHA